MQAESLTVRDLLVAKFESLLAECDLVADNAALGQPLDDMDEFFLIKGRKFLQETFEAKLQERIERTETAAPKPQCPKRKKKTTYQDKKTKTITSAHGTLTITRRYYSCSPCQTHSFPVDVTIGLEKGYTRISRRFVARCCGLGSYRVAADNLRELCGLDLSHTTIGTIADEAATEMAGILASSPVFREVFQKAKGKVEFSADGTCVHVRNADGTHEWRDMKTGALAKRECGASATPEEYGTRELPQPSVVSAFAAIENKEEFQERCQRERRRLGVGGVSSTLADGAPWIWSLAEAVFGKTDECLDIFHALEHISECGNVLYRDAEVSKSWFERMRLVLLSEGFAGMERELSSLEGELKGKGAKLKRASVISLRRYLGRHSGRLNYCERLAAGRVIGSGLIEGACKNLVGRRLKQTGACWRLERANRIATLCAALYSDQWKLAWKSTH
jgi:hypothetical protein